MELHRLRLRNFRQHADTDLRFDRGLTGIVGTNGSGKSTILEAIAFALYGVSAVRGSKDSLKHRGAAPRATVSVELEFTAGAHHVRVERGLSAASVFLGHAETPVATSLGGVTEWVERTLGMTRTEFFTTYFTGQKDLAVMGAMGPADRARFLSRVLGYDRLDAAQQLAREAKRGLVSEASALRATMPDAETLQADCGAALQRDMSAQSALIDATQALDSAVANEARIRPTWETAQSAWAQQERLTQQRRALALRDESVARDVLRLEHERDAIADAVAALPALEAELAWLPALREEGARLDRDAAADTERQRLLGTQSHLQTQLDAMPSAEELVGWVENAKQLVTATTATVDKWLADVEQAERRLAEEEATWREQLATARAELQQARASVRPLIAKRDALVARGPESPCSTCGVALGDRFPEVLAACEAEIAAATEQGTALNARALDLEAEPDAVRDWRRELQQHTASMHKARAAVTEAQDALRELTRRQADRHRLEADVARVIAQIASLPLAYDAARHEVVRSELARLAPAEARRAVLADKAAGHARVADALEQAQQQARAIASEQADVDARIAALGITAEAYDGLRRDYADAERALRAAADAHRAAADAAARSNDAHAAARRRIDETAQARERLVAVDRERLVLEELDRAIGELRADLNAALRPELADLASGLLEVLTDGRYTHAEFGEDYQLTLVEDGLPKPVISGGEEDLCNLVLRLAISQMIAERSGAPFALLILDEVTAALDEQRRANVLAMLRRLSDRFVQIMIITHDASVRDALDHLIRVELNVHAGVSRVVRDVRAGAMDADLPPLAVAA